MSGLESRVSDHAFHEQLREALAVLSGYAASEKEPLAREHLIEIEKILERVSSISTRIDVTVSPRVPLDQASKRLRQVNAELEAFKQTRNQGNLDNALLHAEHVFLESLRLPRVETKEDIGDLQETLVSFRRAIAQHLRYAEEEASRTNQLFSELKTRVEELKSELTQQKTRVDSAVGEFQEQYSSAEDRRRTQFDESQAEIQRKMLEFQKKLEEAESSRASRFSDFTDDLKKGYEKSQSELESEFDLARQSIETKSAGFIEGLERDKEEAEKILGAIAQTGMAKGFQSTANTEKVSMRIWQGITVASLVAFVVVLAMFLPVSIGGDGAFSWILFSQRVLVSFAFAALAAYGAREAARHSEKERTYRRLELEFASIGPFLSRLPKERQENAIEQIADRTFAQNNSSADVNRLPATTSGVVDIIQMTLKELIRKS